MKIFALLTIVILLCLQALARPRLPSGESDVSADGRRALREEFVRAAAPRMELKDGVKLRSEEVSLIQVPPVIRGSPSQNIRRETIVSGSGATVITDGSNDNGGLTGAEKIAIGIGVPVGVFSIAGTLYGWYECIYKKRKEAGQSQRPVESQANQAPPPPQQMASRPPMRAELS